MQEILQKFAGIPEPKDLGSIPGAGILKEHISNVRNIQVSTMSRCFKSAKCLRCETFCKNTTRRDISSFGLNIVFRSKYLCNNISRTMCLENAICLVTRNSSKKKHFKNNVSSKRNLHRNPKSIQDPRATVCIQGLSAQPAQV